VPDVCVLLVAVMVVSVVVELSVTVEPWDAHRHTLFLVSVASCVELRRLKSV